MESNNPDYSIHNDTMLRDAKPEDLNFIYSTWLRGLYYGNSYYNSIDKDTYFNKYKMVLKILLEQRLVNVKVVCFTIDEDSLLGYSVYEGDRLHWVYVKEAWRKMGLGTRLVKPETTSYSHFTNIVKKMLPTSWKFDPFL